MTTLKCLYIIVFTYLSFILLSLTVALIQNGSTMTGYTYLYLATSIALVIGLISNYKSETFTKVRLPLRLWLIILITIVGSALIVIKEHTGRGIWVDEYSQFHQVSFVHNDYIHDISVIAAGEQQPPFHYILSYLSYKTFGMTEIGVRFFSIITFFIICFSVPLMSFLLTKSLTISLVSSIFILSNFDLTFYSVEARPFIMVLLWSILYLFYYVSEGYSSRKLQSSFLSLSLIFFAATSTSIQPISLMVALFLIKIILSKRQQIFNFFRDHALIALVTSPFFYLIYRESSSLGKIKNISPLTTLLSKYIDNILSLSDLLYIQNKTLYLVIIVSFLVIFIKEGNKKVKIGSFLLLPLFILTNILILSYSVNWSIWPRYSMIINSISLIVLIKSLSNIAEKKLFLYTIIALLLSTFTLDLNHYYYSTFTQFQNQLKTKEMYKYLGEKTNETDIAIFMNFNFLGRWRGAHWVAKEIYYNFSNSKINNLLDEYMEDDSIPFIPAQYLSDKTTPTNVYILQRKTWTHFSLKNIKDSKVLEQVEEFGNDYTLYKIRVKGIEDYKKKLISIYAEIPEPFRFSILEALILYSVSENNTNDFEKLIADYNDLDPQKDMLEIYNENPFQRNLIEIKNRKIKYMKDLFTLKNKDKVEIK